MPGWTFLTNHSHALACVARDPDIRVRDIASQMGITERAAHRIMSELLQNGYVRREKTGRRNRYEVQTELPLRHRLDQGVSVGDLLSLILLRQEQAVGQTGQQAATLGL
jgi:DNA-binding IclR family transcriptional regulator